MISHCSLQSDHNTSENNLPKSSNTTILSNLLAERRCNILIYIPFLLHTISTRRFLLFMIPMKLSEVNTSSHMKKYFIKKYLKIKASDLRY